MQGYGAIQIGRHVFAKKGEPGSEVARFVHLWKQENGVWRLARVLSFDHKPSSQSRRQAAARHVAQPIVQPDPVRQAP